MKPNNKPQRGSRGPHTTGANRRLAPRRRRAAKPAVTFEESYKVRCPFCGTAAEIEAMPGDEERIGCGVRAGVEVDCGKCRAALLLVFNPASWGGPTLVERAQLSQHSTETQEFLRRRGPFPHGGSLGLPPTPTPPPNLKIT